MRIVKEIPNPHFKITLFHWNNRYLIKFDAGSLEQTFKISEFDISSENEVIALLDEEFLQQAVTRFHEMATSLSSAIERQA